MANIRPEILVFLRAAQELASTEADLTEEEMDKLAKCMARLESYLQDGHFDGDGHP